MICVNPPLAKTLLKRNKVIFRGEVGRGYDILTEDSLKNISYGQTLEVGILGQAPVKYTCACEFVY